MKKFPVLRYWTCFQLSYHVNIYIELGELRLQTGGPVFWFTRFQYHDDIIRRIKFLLYVPGSSKAICRHYNS